MVEDGEVEDKMLALGDETDGTARAACVLIRDQLRGRATVGGRDPCGAIEQTVARNADSFAMAPAGPRGEETGVQAVKTQEIESGRTKIAFWVYL